MNEVTATDSPEQDLSDLDRDLIKFRGCVQHIGTPLDHPENKEEVRRLRSVIKKKISDAKAKVHQGEKSISRQGIEAQQPSRHLADRVQRFKNILCQEKDLLRQRSDTGGSSHVSNGDAEVHTTHYQSQIAAELEAELEQKEREAEELQALERDILAICEIHNDLVGLMEEHRDAGIIEPPVPQEADIRVGGETKKYKAVVVVRRKTRKLKFCICLLITVPILLILIIATVLMAVFLPRDN